MRKFFLGLLSAFAFCASAPVSAAQFFDFDFTASTPSTPITAHSGSFTIEIDGSSIYLTAINFSVGSTTFDMTNTGFVLDYYYTIGGTFSGTEFGAAGYDDFALRLAFTDPLDPTTFTPHDFWYTTAGYDNIAFAFSDDMTLVLRDVATSVPEPSTWALMLLGFGAIGLSMRHGRRVLAIASR